MIPTTHTFNLTCPEPRAWLVVTSDHQKPCTIEMQQITPPAWSASIDLLPGDYRCRFYCGDDKTVRYHGPAPIPGGTDAGMDTLLSVKAPC